MSTKTTLKRIALVAVSALGFGVLSTVSASAAPAHTAAASLSTSSLTVVAPSATSSYAGRFYVDVTDDEGTLSGLFSDESISVTVIADPDGTGSVTTTGDLYIRAITTSAGSSFSAVTGAPAATATTYQVPSGSAAYTLFDSGNWSYSATAALDNEPNRYWFSIYANAAAALDAGAYTVRVRVINGDANGVAYIDNNLSIKFVSTISGAGARLTLAKSGDLYDGEPLKYETNRYFKATLDNGTTGGRVQTGVADTASLASTAPALNAQILDADGLVDQAIDYVYDTGVATQDHVASTTAALATYQTYYEAGNGVYGVYDSEITANVSSTKSMRVRVTNTSVSATLALTVRDSSGAYDNLTDLTLSAAGISAAAALTQSNVETTTAYTLPLSAKTATLTINVDGATANLANQAMTTKVTWSGNYASANVTPASTTSATTFTDASGNTSVTVTNSSPIAGAVATILITGFKFVSGTTSDPNGSGSRTVTLTWAAPAVTTVSVVDPVASVYAKTGSTTTFSVAVLDQFGAAMASHALRPSLSTASANYSATTTYDTVTTNASGVATWSLTDAAAEADDTDSVTFTSVTDSTKSTSYTITYKATLPAVSALSGFYSDDYDASASSITASIPSTGILNDAGSALALKYDRNLSKSIAASTEADEDDQLAIKIRGVTSAGAAATGAAVTLTAGAGGHVLNTSGLPSSSRTKAIDADGYATFQVAATKPGAISFTVTSGTASYTFVANIAVPTQTKARFVTLSGAATGTANASGVPMTASVTDRYGNGVSGVTITATASGAGSFMGGSTTQSFTTDSTGTYTFLATSIVDAGGSGTFSVTMGNAGDSTSAASKFGATTIDSSVAAGANSASATVTFAAGRNASTVAAEAASDAAAEAIDAANAATDAANICAPLMA